MKRARLTALIGLIISVVVRSTGNGQYTMALGS